MNLRELDQAKSRTFSALKRKHGAALRSRNLVAQTNEVLARCVAFNILILIKSMHTLGVAEDLFGAQEGTPDVH